MLFVIALAMGGWGIAAAQQYPTRQFTVQDGLPHDNVYKIFQDRRGFLWFGTDYGLCIYNGHTFNATFTDSEGLLNSSIMSVYENPDGSMGISSYRNGLLVLKGTTVTKYPLNRQAYPAFSLRAMPGQGCTWVIGKPYLYKVDGREVTKCTISGAGGKEVMFYNIVKQGNRLLFCTSNGLYSLDGPGPQPYLHHLLKDTIVDVCMSKDDAGWVAGKHKIQQVQAGRISREYNLPPHQVVKDILEDRHGNVWIALDGEGMLLIEEGTLRNITNSLPINKTIVNDILEDTEGNIWLATYGAGVLRVSATSVLSYQPTGNNPNIYCRALCGYGHGKLLIGSVGKISLWENGTIKPFPVRALHADHYVYFIKQVAGDIYIGTSQGLIIKNLASAAERTITSDTFGAAISMHSMPGGTVLVGDYTSLFTLSGNRLRMLSGHQRTDRYNVIYGSRNGSIWCGTDKGILVCNSADCSRSARMLSGKRISDILEDSHGRMWAATDNGLHYYERSNWKTLLKEDGLASNKCNKLLQHGNTLWIGTLTGLNMIDLSTLHVRKFTTAITRDDVLSLWCDSSNVLYAGTGNRLLSIELDQIVTGNAPPPVYITHARTSRQHFDWPHMLSLPYNDNKLALGFTALSYQASAAVEYRYKIQGLYDSWSITRNTSVELSALPPGNYVFVLSARANDGQWGHEITLPVTIATPWWRTWWFIAVAALCGMALLAWAARSLAARRHRQLLQYSKIVYLEQQALSALINPHFIFNCMNSIQYYLDNNENDKANSYLADFAHLIRMTLEDAQRTYISLDKEIERIKLYLSLEQLRFGDEFEYEIQLGKTVSPHTLYIPNMILQPYIENAIWHGIMPKKGNGKIWLSFEAASADELTITITDNGVGIRTGDTGRQQEQGHYGMALTEQRLRLLRQIWKKNYRVAVSATTNDAGICTGTRVTIIVPTQEGDAQHKAV